MAYKMDVCNNYLLKHVFGVLDRSDRERPLLQAHRTQDYTGFTFLYKNIGYV